MTTIIANQNPDTRIDNFAFNFAPLLKLKVVSATATDIYLDLGDGDLARVDGTGMKVTLKNGQITDVTGGTLQAVTLFWPDEVNVSYYDINVSFPKMFDLLSSGKIAAARALLFGKDDVIIAREANDRLYGFNGKDLLSGQGGNDTLNGGKGNDTLLGSNDDDTFIFDTALNGKTNVDRIDCFSNGPGDRLHLDNDVFTKLGAVGALDMGRVAIGKAAKDANDRLVYDPASGKMWYDADGTGKVAKVLFAQLPTGMTELPSNIYVIE